MQVPNLKVYNPKQVDENRPMTMYFFDKIKELAETKGLSIPDLANESRIPSGHIYAWDKPIGHKYCRRPSDSNLEALSKTLDVDLMTLLDWMALDRYQAITKAYELLASKEGRASLKQALDIVEAEEL